MKKTIETITNDYNGTANNVEKFSRIYHRIGQLKIVDKQSFVAWLRCYVGGLETLQTVRDDIQRDMSNLRTVVNEFRSKFWFDYSNPFRECGDARHHNLNPRFRVQENSTQTVTAISQLANRIKSDHDLMHNIGRDFVELFESVIIDEYKNLKPFWFETATGLISEILIRLSDKPDGTQPRNERVYGLTGNIGVDKFKRMRYALRCTKKATRILKPARTRASLPYVKTETVADYDNSMIPRFARIKKETIKLQFGCTQDDMVGSRPSAMACRSTIKLLRQPVDRVSNRWLKTRIGVDRSSMATVVTGKPTPIVVDDCHVPFFVLPACWTTDGELVSGRLIVAEGYHDCYHATDDQNIDEIIAPLVNRINADRNRLRDLKTERVNVLRKLRALETLEVSDSYGVGNCRPGTAKFMALLGFESEQCNGRELALRWKRKDYPELRLFKNVVESVYNRLNPEPELATSN